MAVFLLGEPGTEQASCDIQDDIKASYGMIAPTIVDVDSTRIDEQPQWDDVLIVVFQSRDWQPNAMDVITRFRAARPRPRPNGINEPAGFVLPVAISDQCRIPPDPISGLKSILYDQSARGLNGRLAKSLGVFLGLAVSPGEHTIFVSYCSNDGRVIGEDVSRRLREAGFHPWLDEAQEILPGTDVQDRIRQAMATAGLMLLVDTAQAPGRDWIREEIDYANAELIPILPVVIGPQDMTRFTALRALHRRVLVKPRGDDGTPIEDAEWDRVMVGIEELLLEIYRRRLLVTDRTRAAFDQNGFNWRVVDERRRIYRAEREGDLSSHRVLSHCSTADPQYFPAVRSFGQFVNNYPEVARLNEKLFVYDRTELLTRAEVREVRQNSGDFCAIVHHSEVGRLVGQLSRG